MNNIRLILFFVLVCIIATTKAERREAKSRNSRTPNLTNEDPEIKFKLQVELYKKIREDGLMRRSLLSKRNMYDNDEYEEIKRVNALLLLGKHDPEKRKLFQLEGDNLIGFDYITEDENNQNNDPNRKMAYVKVKTVVKTVRKVVSTNIKTINKSTTRKTTTKVPATSIKKTIKKIKTVTKVSSTKKPTPTSNATSNVTKNYSKKASIYRPKPGTKFQWQLSGCEKVKTSVNADVFDIDLFETPKKKIKELKDNGKKVICYFSGGTIESWREDADQYLNKGLILSEMRDWKGENWVNIKSSKLKPLIQNRLDMAVKKGCDGVEVDNVDGYTFKENSFTYSDQLTFNKWLADEAHKRNLSIGLKNDVKQIKDLLSYFDWALNEQCYEYNECELYKPFINANKAVFGVSYLSSSKKIAAACKKANSLKLDYQIKNIELDASKIDCSVYK